MFQLQRILIITERRCAISSIAETYDAEAMFVEWIKETMLSLR
jgi:hypothetical protein